MIDDVNRGDMGWVDQVEASVSLMVLDHTLDRGVLQVKTELQLTDKRDRHLACATRLTPLHQNSVWALDRATCHDRLGPQLMA